MQSITPTTTAGTATVATTRTIRLSTLTTALLYIGVTSVSSLSYAGSFELTTQNLAARSQANAGLGVLDTGASSLYSNPALLANHAGTQASIGTAYTMVNTNISNANSNNRQPTDSNQGDMIDNAIIPSAYFSHNLQDGVTLGIGAYAPFGFNADYEDTFEGRAFGDISEFKTISVSPAVGFELTDKLSAGFSINITKADGTLTSAVSKYFPNSSFSVEGDDISGGYTVGLYAQPTELISVGLVHRSKEKFTLEGNSFANIPAQSISNVNGKGSLIIVLPARTELSVGVNPTDKIGLYATVSHTEWDSIQQIQVQTTALANTPPPEIFNYQNSYFYAIGADYQLTDAVTLRGGVAKDNSPTQDLFRSVRLPTTDRMLYALGASVQINPHASVDIGYSYVDENTAPIAQISSLTGETYTADFKNSASLLLMQYNHRF